MAHFLNPENDCILVQSDAAFNVCLMALAGLGNNLQFQSMQEVSIDNIESNDPHDSHRFVFGGMHAAVPARRAHAFAKTASSVMRMCMLRSANAGYCPVTIGAKAHTRNRDKMNVCAYSVPNAPKFELSPTNNRMHIMEYYSYYDRMHPHFMIENQLRQRKPGQMWTVMQVFRKKFSEVVEFTTNMNARDMSGEQVEARDGAIYIHPPGTFSSFVNVRCTVRKITNPSHPSLQLFKALCDRDGQGGAQRILENYRKALEVNRREPEPLPPHAAESEEESDDYKESEDEEDKEFPDHVTPIPTAPPKVLPPNYYCDGQPDLGMLSLQMSALGLGR